ncbi:hypothetical protein PIB30_041369 [Stylosanthes scabra]|uniref:Uncharacterized protein n=1 Tax=Stylosanthes scabra TaxID=79078 RepID=A0ABU6ZDM4_9FABA|nr:hypothetical protein [Stylosanthes scabra]
MKLALLIALSYFFLLFVTLSNKLPLALSDINKYVISLGGEPVSLAEPYYILPSTFLQNGSQGGGLILGQTMNNIYKNNSTATRTCPCPLTVLQDYHNPKFFGFPVFFTTPSSQNKSTNNNKYISTSTPLDITFRHHKPINCAKSLKWIVVVDHDFPYPYIGVGGGDHDQSDKKKIVNGTFHFEEFNDNNDNSFYLAYYELVFCPTSSSIIGGGCKGIGRYNNGVHGNQKRLILIDKDPFQIGLN